MHAGQNNEGNRGHLDRVIPMRSLPENQSGEGRHKCPYCAYQAGYGRRWPMFGIVWSAWTA